MSAEPEAPPAWVSELRSSASGKVVWDVDCSSLPSPHPPGLFWPDILIPDAISRYISVAADGEKGTVAVLCGRKLAGGNFGTNVSAQGTAGMSIALQAASDLVGAGKRPRRIEVTYRKPMFLPCWVRGRTKLVGGQGTAIAVDCVLSDPATGKDIVEARSEWVPAPDSLVRRAPFTPVGTDAWPQGLRELFDASGRPEKTPNTAEYFHEAAVGHGIVAVPYLRLPGDPSRTPPPFADVVPFLWPTPHESRFRSRSLSVLDREGNLEEWQEMVSPGGRYSWNGAIHPAALYILMDYAVNQPPVGIDRVTLATAKLAVDFEPAAWAFEEGWLHSRGWMVRKEGRRYETEAIGRMEDGTVVCRARASLALIGPLPRL
ncbi:hypothetical protein DFJ74DRAFT_687368 [Hyaloraphidium curvatum]|nr:hypothetical protein DFJ74DRAFT_687368 [Hyaloraphidium curvatum]